MNSTTSYLNTPPATPTLTDKYTDLSLGNGSVVSAKSLEDYYQLLNIHFVHSALMPNASKIKANAGFTWPEVHFIIATNRLELFARSSAQTKQYLEFKHELKELKVSILDHILNEELRWKMEDLREEGEIFAHESDIKILYNKFPYYFEEDVSHLCVWSKVRIPTDPNSDVGDISEETREQIRKYIENTFIKPLGITWDDVEWFKNWTSLQSVRSISHIHVLIKGGDKNKIEEMIETGGVV